MADPSLPSSALHCCQDHAAEAVGDDEHERCGDDEQDRCDIPHNHAANHTPPGPIGTEAGRPLVGVFFSEECRRLASSLKPARYGRLYTEAQ